MFSAIHAPLSHRSISVILSSLLYSQKQNLHKRSLEARVKTASLSAWDNSYIKGIFRKCLQVFRGFWSRRNPYFKNMLAQTLSILLLLAFYIPHTGSAQVAIDNEYQSTYDFLTFIAIKRKFQCMGEYSKQSRLVEDY